MPFNRGIERCLSELVESVGAKSVALTLASVPAESMPEHIDLTAPVRMGSLVQNSMG